MPDGPLFLESILRPAKALDISQLQEINHCTAFCLQLLNPRSFSVTHESSRTKGASVMDVPARGGRELPQRGHGVGVKVNKTRPKTQNF